MYGDAEEVIGRGDRRAPRRGLPGLQGPSRARHAEGHHRGLRAVARAASGPTGWTRYLLHWRRRASAGGHHRRLRGAPAGGQDPVLGREQLRRPRARGGARDRRRGPDRLQPGPLSPGGARDRARRDPLVREARRRRGRVQPVRARALSRPPHEGRPRAAGDRRGARRHPAAGRAAVPRAAARRSSRSRRPGSRSTSPRTPAPGASGSPRPSSPGSSARFRAAGVPASSRRSRAPRTPGGLGRVTDSPRAASGLRDPERLADHQRSGEREQQHQRGAGRRPRSRPSRTGSASPIRPAPASARSSATSRTLVGNRRALEVRHLARSGGHGLGGDVVARQPADPARHEVEEHELIEDAVHPGGVGQAGGGHAEADHVGERVELAPEGRGAGAATGPRGRRPRRTRAPAR